MQPISGKPVGSTVASKCIETRSTCVVWDGPDINCLGVNLCKGQSIDIIIYNTAKKLCEVLDALKIDMVDLSCLVQGDTTGTPTNMQELFNLVISKLCTLQTEVTALENTGTTDIMVPLPPCLQYTIPDPNNPGNFITISSLSLIDPVTSSSPIVEYLTTKICQLFSELADLTVRVEQLELTVQTLMDTVATGVPSADVPPCIGASPMLLVDPQFPDQGAVPMIANLLCDLLEQTGTPTQVGQTSGDCSNTFWSGIGSQVPLGNYAPASPATMEDLGFVNNPTQLWEKINNLWVTVCDIRNFCSTVKATCCPTMCEDVEFQMGIVPTSTGRNILTLFLNGSYNDPVTNQLQTGLFNFLGTFPVCSTPVGVNCWNVFQPATVVITDGDLPPNTYPVNLNGTDMYSLYNGGTYTINLPGTFNFSSSYDVVFTGNVIAPDYSVCALSQTKTLVATCDNLTIGTITVSDVSYNGFTVAFVEPNPAPSTVLTGFTFTIQDVGSVNPPITLSTTDIGFGTYYIYPSTTDIPNNPCPAGCLNLVQTSQILENTTYQISIVANYNCGDSAPISSTSPFTTLVAIEITINGFSDASCIDLTQPAQLLLIPDAGTLPTDYSPNFTTPIVFDPISPITLTVYGTPGVNFGYQLITGALKSGNFSSANTGGANCDTLNTVKCWGPPSLRRWNSSPTGYPADGYDLTTGYLANASTYSCSGAGCIAATSAFVDAGCYDYLNYSIVPSNSIVNNFIPGTIVNNAWNGSPATQAEPGIYSYGYASVDNQQFTIPNQNGSLTINQNFHLLNNGSAPKITIKLTDPNAILAQKQSMWISAPGAKNTLIYSGAIINNVPTLGSKPASYESDTTNYTVTQVKGIPVFMRIEIIRWSGSTWIYPSIPSPGSGSCPTEVIYVTADWMTVPNITTTGYTLPNIFNIGAKDRIRITFSAGGWNNSVNNDYVNSFPAGADEFTNFYSRVTVSQDPFTNATAGNPGPYLIYKEFGSSTNPNINNTTLDTQLLGLGTELSGDFSATPPNHDYGLEFIVTDDLTIEWEISY